MHFDSRTQAALREVGLSTAEIETASDLVVERVQQTAAELESFFTDGGQFYADIDLAHSDSEVVALDVEYLDVYTHAADLRGYLRLDGWGVPVEDGRVLSGESETPTLVELTLGPTVHDRVRFAREEGTL
jgi:hypothetical protein